MKFRKCISQEYRFLIDSSCSDDEGKKICSCDKISNAWILLDFDLANCYRDQIIKLIQIIKLLSHMWTLIYYKQSNSLKITFISTLTVFERTRNIYTQCKPNVIKRNQDYYVQNRNLQEINIL